MTPAEIHEAGMDELVTRHQQLEKFAAEVQGTYLRAAEIELKEVRIELRRVALRIQIKGHNR
jgi:hypothetical protein